MPGCGSSSSLRTRRGQPRPAARRRARRSRWPRRARRCGRAGGRARGPDAAFRGPPADRVGRQPARRRRRGEPGECSQRPARTAGLEAKQREAGMSVHLITVRLYSTVARPLDPPLRRRSRRLHCFKQLIDCFRQLSGPESRPWHRPRRPPTEAVRRFNRFYTRRIGVLHEGSPTTRSRSPNRACSGSSRTAAGPPPPSWRATSASTRAT